MSITANQVTVARILLLPVPTALVLWGHPTGLIIALFIGTAIGATDALDGYLARRDGPTTLGALLDPTADKLFMAVLLLAIASQGGYCPTWIVSGIFVRELLITGLRTSMACRQAEFTTSRLGKLKTVVQMGGLLVFFFTAAAMGPDGEFIVMLDMNGVRTLHGVGSIGCILAVGLYYLVKKRWLPFWLVGIGPIWFCLFISSLIFERETCVFAIFLAMIVMTWLSGADYIVGAWKVLQKNGWNKEDHAIIFWALGICSSILLVADHHIILIPIMVSLAAELATAGIDNVAAAERQRRADAAQYLCPAFFALLTTVIGFAFGETNPNWLLAAGTAQMGVSLFLLFRAYRREREVLLS
jgi:CDP-diacylglycerol--glycerol-3-phosphate 3-phosphatidyltransferase